jgi:hypothetical protein
MTGHPVRLLTAAALAAAASLLTVSAASAGCFGCNASYDAPPVVQYTAPVVYSYSYAAPVTYAAPSCGCGGYAASYQSPMYVVNQGPTYDAPVVGEPEEAAPALDYGYRRAYPYIGGGARWHHRGYGHRGYGDRGWGHRGFGHRGLGYRGFGYREGYRGFRHGLRYGMRHTMVGPGGMYRPRHGFMPQHRMGGGQMHMMRTPGVVHPRMGGQGRRPGQP